MSSIYRFFLILQGFDYKSIIYLLIVSSGALYLTHNKVYHWLEYVALIFSPAFYIPVKIWIDHGMYVAVYPITLFAIYHLATKALAKDFQHFVEQITLQAKKMTDDVYLQLSEIQQKNKLVEERNKELEIKVAAYEIIEQKKSKKKK